MTALPLALLLPVAGGHAQDAGEGEQYRLRFVNEAEGPIEYSLDGGRQWELLGKVTRAAAAVTPSTSVLSVVQPGTVAGVQPEQLLLRLPADKRQLRSLRILAKGQAPLSAAIMTDIPPKSSIFRTLAPPTGSRLLIETEAGAEPMPPGWMPKQGDHLIISVSKQPPGDPPSVVIENKEGGEVVYSTTGGLPQIIAKVKQPLKGIGRYGGTERGGLGMIPAWSPTAVVVSTASTLRRMTDENQPVEDRGGFVIQPAEPQLRGATHPASQILLEALPEGDVKPAIARFFGLSAPVSTGDPLDRQPTRVEISIDGGDWEPVPDLRGTINEEAMLKALSEAYGGKRKIEKGITSIRILFGTVQEANFRRRLQLAATPLAEQVQRGKVTISANVMGEGVAYVSFRLNGIQQKITNQKPFSWEWDTRKWSNGEHLLEIRGLDEALSPLTTVTTKVLVDN